MGSFSDEQDDNLVLVYRFIETHTYLIGKNDKCQNPKFKSNPNYQMSKILIDVRYFEL